MYYAMPILLAYGPLPWLAGVFVLIVFAAIAAAIVFNYGGIWFRAYMSSANISLLSLIGMSFRRVDSRVIVLGKIMAVQAGIGAEKETGITTRRLEAHYLAGGNVPNVIKAIIAAHRADIDLDFDRAAAIDLAGRDVLDAVQTSVYPKVIDCPDPKRSASHHPQRHRQEWRRVEGSRPGDRPHEHRATDRRGHRRDDHRPRGRRDHHGHRLVGQPPARDGESRPDLQGGVAARAWMRRRPSRSSRSTSPTSTWARTSAPACRPIRPRPTRASLGRRPKSGVRWPPPASRR